MSTEYFSALNLKSSISCCVLTMLVMRQLYSSLLSNESCHVGALLGSYVADLCQHVVIRIRLMLVADG